MRNKIEKIWNGMIDAGQGSHEGLFFEHGTAVAIDDAIFYLNLWFRGGRK